MNWDDLRVFLAVARGDTISRAAKSLGVDPTTISRRLSRLSEALGTTIFEPSDGAQVLTESGSELLRYAEQMEQMAITARTGISGQRSLLSGVIRISVAEGFGTWLIARNLIHFQRANPNIVIELIASSGFLNPSKREADVAVMLSRPKTGPLVVRRLTDYCLRLYATPVYLENAAPLRTPADLQHHTLIGYVPDIVYSPALDYLSEIRPGRAPEIRSSSINAQHALAVSGAGLCMLPCFIGEQDERLVSVDLDVELTRSFWLIVHRDVRQLARVAAFVDWLCALVTAEREVLMGTKDSRCRVSTS
jgi:DNA-binding transcriptional LysR family regulator